MIILLINAILVSILVLAVSAAALVWITKAFSSPPKCVNAAIVAAFCSAGSTPLFCLRYDLPAVTERKFDPNTKS